MLTNLKKLLGKDVEVVFDRPLGSIHPKHDFTYPVNYGYVPNTRSSDGEELDAYFLGTDKPLKNTKGICIAIIHRTDDDDDKLIVTDGKQFSDEQIEKLIEFQEKWFKHVIIRECTIKNRIFAEGKVYKLTWHDCDNFDKLPIEKCTQSYGACFYEGKLVITRGEFGKWNFVGGHIEKGETPEIALVREVKEESNMRVVKQTPIGYQEVKEEDGKIYFQLRFCCMVEPIGKFEKDPDGNVIEIKLINPKDVKKYFDWGEIGDRIMERSISVLRQINSK